MRCIGFAVNGYVDPAQVLRKGRPRVGHAVIVTKAVGTGTLFAANMRGQARGEWIAAAYRRMLLSNRSAAAAVGALQREHEAHCCCTDITGFGLIGHLLEMIQFSDTVDDLPVAVKLSLGSVPLLPGARECVRRGITSSLQPSNVRCAHAVECIVNIAEYGDLYPLLFDPQVPPCHAVCLLCVVINAHRRRVGCSSLSPWNTLTLSSTNYMHHPIQMLGSSERLFHR